MANHLSDRKDSHAYAVENRRGTHTIHYSLKTVPKKSGLKKKAYARLKEKEPLGAAALMEEVAKRNPILNPQLVHMVLESVAEVAADNLRQGRRVTLEGLFSMGVSLPGSIDPKRPLDAKKLTLKPWTRFSQRFITLLNKGAQIVYDGAGDDVEP